MAYTTIKKPTDYFNTKLYTGNGSTNAITGVGFQPDLTWIKIRDAAGESHSWWDAVRTATKYISSNNDNAEATDATGLTAFDSDGFTLGSTGRVNQNTNTFASWNWKANGAGSSNTDGSISSTVSANTTSKFSIVKWVGTGSNATIGHGLGVKPAMIITKPTSDTGSWYTYHKSLDATDFIKLNDTDATADNATVWNDTEPTTSVFTTGTAFDSGRTFIAYCFADVAGFSKFGSYIGNNGGDNGVFVYTGFKPHLVIQKLSSHAGANWYMRDTTRSTFNPMDKTIRANTTGDFDYAEKIDFYSNGFKTRANGLNQQDSGYVYIYMAFAAEPLIGDNPATAR